MLKLILIVVTTLVICGTVCFATNKVCNTFNSNMAKNEDQHIVLKEDHETLMRDHEALMRVGTEIKKMASDTNRKITFLYNMVKNQNPDIWNERGENDAN